MTTSWRCSARVRAHFVATCLVPIACSALEAAIALAAARPNVVFIIADDMGYADVGFNAARTGTPTEFKTPNLDALAAQSVQFAGAYDTSSICSPSRAGILTGRYQQRYGFHYAIDNTDGPNEGIPVGETLLFEQMKSQGYSTGAVGKWHIGQHPQWLPNVQGVDSFYGFWEGLRDYFNLNNGINPIRRDNTEIAWWTEPSYNGTPPDPVRGRYLTDAFTDEATKYIADHAAAADPFMLYVAYNAPHIPYHAKASDLAMFDDTSLTGDRKTVAAMTYAMDRGIGLINQRLSDPNGDGDTSDSIADNTIVIFTNDNGGPVDQNAYSNGQLAGFKGSAYEGGIRVPALIRMPGVTPGVFAPAISATDWFPTIVDATGGTLPTNLDGVSLVPYLNGSASGPTHQYFYQYTFSAFASIQDAEWKLVRPTVNDSWRLYRLNPDGTGETVNVAAQYPGKVSELARALIHWVAGVDKPLNTSDGKANRTDGFTYRNDSASQSSWSRFGAWTLASTGAGGTLRSQDATSRVTMEFTVNNARNYNVTNDLGLGVGISLPAYFQGNRDPEELQVSMINELRLSGEFTAPVSRDFQLSGTPFLFTASPEGDHARITVAATDASATADYSWTISTGVQLLDDLYIVGDGATQLVFAGDIREFDQAKSVFKTSANRVVFAGANTYQGDTVVSGGVLELAGYTARIANNGFLVVQDNAEFRLTGGHVDVQGVSVDPGAAFTIAGGTLHADNFVGDLANGAGVVQVGGPQGVTHILGAYAQSGTGELNVSLLPPSVGGETPYLSANSIAFAGGKLEFTFGGFIPRADDRFHVFDAAHIDVTALSMEFPTLPIGLLWNASTLLSTGWLSVASAGGSVSVPGDFNLDQAVDAADLAIWQARYGGADGSDPTLTADNFLDWQRYYSPAPGVAAAVPEPPVAHLALLPIAAFALRSARVVAGLARDRHALRRRPSAT